MSVRRAHCVRMVLGLTLLLGACGGRTMSDALDTTLAGATSATGGSTSSIVGGAQSVEATGGVPWAVSGGAFSAATGGFTWSVAGGSWNVLTGGQPSASATGGSGVTSCAAVRCASIPSTCKQIVQAPDACCPTCTDTGCAPCDNIICASGMHLETPVGACCPQCVNDPLDPCTKGQQDYASLRTAMVDKYSSAGCQNSSDCVIVPENNPCAQTCGVALPSQTSNYLQSNLGSTALTDCATCSPPPSVLCELTVAACVNGKCVAVNQQ